MLWGKKNKGKTVDVIIGIICSLILAVVCTSQFDVLNGVKIVGDEYAYWGIGAFFSGIKWESMHHTIYYSYGYSILLIPFFGLMRMGVGVLTVYKAVIVMNILFLIISFWISLYLSRHFFSNISSGLRACMCLGVALYINNIVQAGYAWDETLLYLMFWCTLLAVIKAVEKPVIGRIFWVAVTSVYCSMIHMRAVGVLVSAIIVMALFIFYRRKEFKIWNIIGISALFLIGIALFWVGKEWVTEYVYGNNSGMPTNTMAGQMEKIKLFFSIPGIVDLFNSLTGKVFYECAASFLLFPLGMCFAAERLIQKGAEKFKKRRLLLNQEDWGVLFLFLSVWAELLISAVFKVNQYYSSSVVTDRIDNIFYGRYAEFCMGPIILLGFLAFFNKKRYIIYSVISTGVFAVTAIITQIQFDQFTYYKDLPQFTGNPSAFSGIYYMMDGNYENLAYRIFCFSVLILLLCICIKVILHAIGRKEVFSIAIVFLMAGIWVYYGTNRVYLAATEKNWRNKSFQSVSELVSGLDTWPECYFVSENLRGNCCWLQWWLPLCEVNEITPEEFEGLYQKEDLQNTLFFSESENYTVTGMMSDRLNYIYNSGDIGVFVMRGSELEAELSMLANSSYEFPNPHWEEVDLSVAKTDLCDQKPDGNLTYNWSESEGYLTWQTGIELEDGEYEFVIELEIPDIQEEAGYISITNEEGTYFDTRIINVEDFGLGNRAAIHVQLPAKNYERPVIGIYTYGKYSMKIREIKYRQINARRVLEDNTDFEKLFALLADLKENDVWKMLYVDSDGSGKKGFPDLSILSQYLPGRDIEYVEGALLPYKSLAENPVLLVEQNLPFDVVFHLLPNYMMIGQGEEYSIWVPRQGELAEKLYRNGVEPLTPETDAIDLQYLGTSRLCEGHTYWVELPDGQYEIDTCIEADSNTDVNGWLKVGDQKVAIESASEKNDFYLEGEEQYEIALLPNEREKWNEARCLIKKVDNNRITTVSFDNLQSVGVDRLADGYVLTIPGAVLRTNGFELGARHYGIAISFSSPLPEGYALFYRNGRLQEKIPLSDASPKENGFELEHLIEEYDLAEWKVELTVEKAYENVIVNDMVKILEYR